jgi:chaperone BCS1
MDSSILYVALGGALVSLKQIPGILFDKVKERLVTSITIDKGTDLYEILEEWLYKNYHSKLRNIEVSMDIRPPDTPPGGKKEIKPIKYGFKQGYFLMTYEGTRVLVYKHREKTDRSSSNFIEYYTLSSLKEVIIKTILEKIYVEFIDSKTKASLFTTDAWGNWYIVKQLHAKPLDSIVLNGHIKEDVISDIQEFLESEDWYNTMNMQYNRGYLFYGPPGNGKTSLCIALAQKFKRDLYAIDLAGLEDDSRLKQAFTNIPCNAVLLLEDIDKAFVERSNKDAKAITFSCLLNCLNGVYQKSGVITIMTTNYIDRLDTALIRSGRVDKRIFIGNPTTEQINQFICNFYGKEVGETKYRELSMSDVQETCIRNKKDMVNVLKELKDE